MTERSEVMAWHAFICAIINDSLYRVSDSAVFGATVSQRLDKTVK